MSKETFKKVKRAALKAALLTVNLEAQAQHVPPDAVAQKIGDIRVQGFAVDPPCVIATVDGQAVLDPWMRDYAWFVEDGTETAFRTARGYNGFRGDAGDVAVNVKDTWSAIWEGLQGHEVRTRPVPPRRPNGTAILKGVRIADLKPCTCSDTCRCPQDQMSLQRYLFKVAFSLGDQLTRMRVERDQRASRAKFKAKRTRKAGGLPPEESLGSATFPQRVPRAIQHGDPDAEPLPDPRTAMSLRPGPELMLAVESNWSATHVVGYDSGSVINAALKKHGPRNPVSFEERYTSVLDAWAFRFPVTQSPVYLDSDPPVIFAPDQRTSAGRDVPQDEYDEPDLEMDPSQPDLVKLFLTTIPEERACDDDESDGTADAA